MKTAAANRAEPSPSCHPAVTAMARIGYGARGFIYFLVGVTAALAALQPGRHPEGLVGALQMFQHGHGLGGVLVIAGAIGLACLAGWFTAAGVAATDLPGAEKYLRLADRFGDAIVYAAFIIDLLGLMFGWWSGNADNQLQSWISWFLGQPYGRLLVGAVGVGILASGAGMIVWAVRGDVAGRLALPPTEARLLRRADRFGYSGRGAAVALCGCFLLAAAIHGNPREAHQLGGALAALSAMSYGRALLGLFALAFMVSGIGDIGAALFRQFDPRSKA